MGMIFGINHYFQFLSRTNTVHWVFVCLFVIVSDQSFLDKIHLQALPWCGGSLFCFPLHFHSGRRCTQPEKGLNQSLLKDENNFKTSENQQRPSTGFLYTERGLNQSLLKDERNLLTKNGFSGYVSATRGGTPSNSFEGSINPLVF